MRRALPLVVATLLVGCMEDPAELPEFTAYSWHDLIEEGTPATAAYSFDGGAVVVAGGDGSVATYVPGEDPLQERPVTTELLTVWGTAPDSVWAGGGGGVILTNIGGVWRAEPTPTNIDIEDLSGWAAGRMMGVGSAGRLLERRDGVWSLNEISGNPYLIRVACADDGRVHVLDTTGLVSVWTGGDELNALPLPDIGKVADIAHADDGLWAVGSVATARWDGTAWATEPNMPNGGRRLAVVDGTICVAGDAVWWKRGAGWVEYPAPALSPIAVIADAPGADLVALLDDGAIHRRHAAAWSMVQKPLYNPIIDIAGSAHNDVHAVGDNGLFVHWNGVELSNIDVGVFQPRALWCVSPDTTVCVGDDGLAFVGAGDRWAATPTGVGSDLLSVWGRSARDAYAVGAEGILLHWDGGSWSELPAPDSDEAFLAVSGEADGKLFILDDADVVWYRDAPAEAPWTAYDISGWKTDLDLLVSVRTNWLMVGGPGGSMHCRTIDGVAVEYNGTSRAVLDAAQGCRAGEMGYVSADGSHRYYYGVGWADQTQPHSDRVYNAVHYFPRNMVALGSPLGGLTVYGP